MRIAYAGGTSLELGGEHELVFCGGRALCPDGVVRAVTRTAPDAAESILGSTVRAQVKAFGRSVTGSLLLRRPESSIEPAPVHPVRFVPDPETANGGIFDSHEVAYVEPNPDDAPDVPWLRR